MISKKALIVPVALLCASCVHYKAQPISPTQRAVTLTSRRLAAKTWTLRALQDEAVRTLPDVAVARAQYETAHAAIRTAGERPNPTVALAPTAVTPFTTWMAGTYAVDFDWTIETAGKRSIRLDTAREQSRAAAARVVDAIWKARAAVRRALLDLYAGEQRAKWIGEAVARQEELLQLAEQRIAAGEEPRSAISQPRLLQAQLRLQAADATRSIGLARASLAEAMGMGSAGLSGATFSFTSFEKRPASPPDHRMAALSHRSDVIAALADYAATESALRQEIAKQYPDIHLNPGYQLDAGEHKWTLGIGLTLPILNQNRGAIGEAEAKRREAAAKFDSVQAKALAECDRAYAALRAARTKLEAADELLATQEKQIATEQRLLAEGAGDRLALLSAQVERATTLASRLDAYIELQSAYGALEEATQTPLTP